MKSLGAYQSKMDSASAKRARKKRKGKKAKAPKKAFAFSGIMGK